MEQEDQTNEIRKALLLIPRAARAKAQGMRSVYEIDGVTVKRDTRRFWFIGASKLTLGDAIKALCGQRAA